MTERRHQISGDLLTRLIEARVTGGRALECAVYDAFALGLSWKVIANRVGYGRTRLYELRNAEKARRFISEHNSAGQEDTHKM